MVGVFHRQLRGSMVLVFSIFHWFMRDAEEAIAKRFLFASGISFLLNALVLLKVRCRWCSYFFSFPTFYPFGNSSDSFILLLKKRIFWFWSVSPQSRSFGGTKGGINYNYSYFFNYINTSGGRHSTTPLFQTIQNNTLQNQPHHLLWLTPSNSSQSDTLQVKSHILVKHPRIVV